MWECVLCVLCMCVLFLRTRILHFLTYFFNPFFHPDKILVIGNTGSNATREALHATEQGFAVGMAAALQINPYYGERGKEKRGGEKKR